MYAQTIWRNKLTTRWLTILLQEYLHLIVTDDYARLRQEAKQYPKHVSLFRGASFYARLAEPKALHDLMISSSAPSYHLETPTDAFNMTPRGGIIYVSNVTALHKMPDTLKWAFKILYHLIWVSSCLFTVIKWFIKVSFPPILVRSIRSTQSRN